MKKICFVFTLVIIFSRLTCGQTSYLVGTGQSSIEPDRSLISLALSGYAAPMEGRFSLYWKRMEKLPEIVSMGGAGYRLFIIANNEILSKSVIDDSSGWTSLGKADDFIAVTGADDELYVLTRNKDILRSGAGKINWEKLIPADKSVTSIAVTGNKIYAGSSEGKIFITDLDDAQNEWKSKSTIWNIISLASLNDELFALTGEGDLYKCNTTEDNPDWTKIAYRNNISIKEDIRYIAIAANGIFGVSKENILYLGDHRSEGNLTARAIAIKDDDKTALIVSIDLLGLTDKYLGILKNEIFKKHGVEPSAVLMNLSHTHFAPVVVDWPTWMEYYHHPNQKYLNTIVRDGILNAANEALASLSPARLYFGRGETDIGYNRSLNDHPELYDNSVDVLKIRYDNKRESYIFLASCHPVFSTASRLHYTLSANYPGVARTLVEERTNTKNSVFLQGTAGDINPRDNGQYITGEKLSNEVISVLSRPLEEITGPISFFLDTINVKVKPMSRAELVEFRSRDIDKPKDISAIKNVKYADLIIDHYDRGTLPVSNPVYVQTINVGNWKLVGFSREATSEYSLAVKEMFPGRIVSVTGYSNDVSSYLPTSHHIQKRNYEGLDSFFWYGEIPFPLTVHETIMSILKNLNR